MEDEKGRKHHLRCRKGDVGRYVLLPGDPGRCVPIASRLENARMVATNREYTTYTGYLDDEKVSVTSTGIGGPSTAIAVEELSAIGADTFIRVGTAGGMQVETLPGDLVVASAAVRDEGTANQYMPLAFPAVADFGVTAALAAAAASRQVHHHVGIVHSKDSFYGEVEPTRMPVAGRLAARWKAWLAGGVLCSEMESATLFVVASVLKKRAGGLMLVMVSLPPDVVTARQSKLARAAEPPTIPPDQIPAALDRLIDTAVDALRLLIMEDNGMPERKRR